jgi:hypothetical protein
VSQNGHVVASSANETWFAGGGGASRPEAPCNRDAYAAAQPVTPHKIDEISHDLRGNDATANLHPQSRRLDQPTEAARSVALSSKNSPPTDLPAANGCAWADLFKAQTLSRGVPGQANVVPARTAMQTPNRKKIPTAIHGRA